MTSDDTFVIMISKFIREKIEQRFGRPLKYSKQVDDLAGHIAEVCNSTISPSTLRRLLGFVKNTAQPREYSLDILAEYVGHKSWTHLIKSLERSDEEPVKVIERLKPSQIKNGQTIQINYEPHKQVIIKRTGKVYKVVVSNEKKLQLNDEVEFRIIELHYPLTFTHVMRLGKSIGSVQVAIVSGITMITKG